MDKFPFRYAIVDTLEISERRNTDKEHCMRILNEYGHSIDLIRLPEKSQYNLKDHFIYEVTLSRDITAETIAILNENGYRIYTPLMRLGRNPPAFLDAYDNLWRMVDVPVAQPLDIPSNKDDSP